MGKGAHKVTYGRQVSVVASVLRRVKVEDDLMQPVDINKKSVRIHVHHIFCLTMMPPPPCHQAVHTTPLNSVIAGKGRWHFQQMVLFRTSAAL